MAELEEYISNLITLLAHERDDPNAAISSVPLDKLTPKDFDTKRAEIDMPEQQTEAGEEFAEEEAVIDPRVLYKNFIATREGGPAHGGRSDD